MECMTAIDSNDGFKPIRPNPYVVGNPVRDASGFFGREAEFELVQKRFESSSVGSLMVFCGERRSGKTSILMQIQQGRLGREFVPILIDLQGVSTIADIVDAIRVQYDGPAGHVPPFDAGTTSASNFGRFVESLVTRMDGRKLLLMFDEYEKLEDRITSGVMPREFLPALANLMENSSVFVVFAGGQHLEERREDYWHILAKAHDYRRLSYLGREDATRLIRQPLSGKAEFPDPVIDEILRLTAGQPFYTQ